MTWMLAASAWQRAGLESLVLTLLIVAVFGGLVWRWRKSGTVMRCAMVSLLAHLILLLYACRVQWGPALHGGGGGLVTIRLRDEEHEPLAPSPKPQDGAEASPSSPSDVAADRSALPESPSASANGSDTALDIEPSTIVAALPERTSDPAVPTERASAAPPSSQEPRQPPPPGAAQTGEPAPTFPADAGPAPDHAESPAPEPPPAASLLPPTPPPSPPRPADLAPAFPVEPLPAGNVASDAADAPLPVAADPLVPRAPQRHEPGVPPLPTVAPSAPQVVPPAWQARLAPDRLAVGQRFGATPQSEAAVAAALDWLAHTQSPDGRWNAAAFGAGRETRTLGHDRQGAGARADTGMTALALLAFLGTGQTHLAGPHQTTLHRGLAFLLSQQAPNGSLAGQAELFAAMYCHGMASLALAEAYALTRDAQLLPGLRRALDYSLASQHAAGGWRYQPHDAGDMSQFGWQVMALSAGQLGGLPIPDATQHRMRRFLRSCAAGGQGGLASYRPGDRPTRTMTAEALVCRWLLDDALPPEGMAEATSYLLEELPGQGPANFYYWYYATLALFPQQGPAWQRWNSALQGELLPRQRRDGWAAGSWDPNDLWGGYGGRVYSTALATLCLEVYYRYLPHEALSPPSRLTDRLLMPIGPR